MRTRIHINLLVEDLDASTAFYRSLFGVAPSKVRADYANWRLDEPALHLALVLASAENAGGAKPNGKRTHEHFGVELFDDAALKSWRERVEGAGLTVRREEAVTCCYAVADKFWAADPDGNEWEFWVRHEEAEAMHGETMPSSTVESAASPATGCCAPPAPGATGCC